MRPRRFDTQIQSVFMVLSGLLIVVGLASVGVNSFLSRSQQQVLSTSIAVIERTERVALDADLAASLADQLAKAETDASADEVAGRLSQTIARIEDDIGAMRSFLNAGSGEGRAAAEAREQVQQILGTVRRAIRLKAAAEAERDGLVAAGQRLADLIATQTDLARLRITAGIWELYAQPSDGLDRRALDRLADVEFFGFERLGELAEANAAMTRLLARLADDREAVDHVAIQGEFGRMLRLARDRTRFMPSPGAREEAGREIDILASAEAAGGMWAVRQARIAELAELASLVARLGEQLAGLTAEAQQGRIETRAYMEDQIAAAGRRATYLAAGLVAFTLMALFTGFLVWRRTRARVVVRLSAVADRIVAVAQGDTGRPMDISGRDEIGRLEKALNILRRRAEEAARLRRSLEDAVRARTAEVVAEMQLSNAARADAEAESRAKTHFLARMSHEIRTPLNGVVGLLDLLAREEADDARRARLETALTSARDLQAMTEDILAFASNEDEPGGGRLAAFDPLRLAKTLAEHLRILASEKGLAAVIRIGDGLPAALVGDAIRIRQVVMNLITNAVKYTETGEVRLTVAHHASDAGGAHAIRFTVADTGPGMTAEETRQAFDIYGRSMDARRRGVPGVGLGLAIVRQLTDAMGGELRVSTAPGMGSSFTLALTLPAAAAVEGPADLPSLPSHPGLRVLIVDDHPVNRLVARGYLERMGCIVSEAADGKAALAQVEGNTFDVILIDLDLPDMRGEQIVERIKGNGARLAILTADPVRDDSATRQRFGVDHVLTKPISLRDLARALDGGRVPDPVPDASVSRDTEAILREDVANLGAGPTADIVRAFLDDLASAVPTLLATQDNDRRARLAHRIKGAAGNFGLSGLCDLLQRIQTGDDTALEPLAETARRAADAVTAAADRLGLAVQDPAGGAKQ